MADLRDEHGNPIQLADQYGNPVKLTDEYGNPVHITGIATTGQTAAVEPQKQVPPPPHPEPQQQQQQQEQLRRSGSSSSSSSSSEDDGQGGRRKKKGLKEKIKETLGEVSTKTRVRRPHTAHQPLLLLLQRRANRRPPSLGRLQSTRRKASWKGSRRSSQATATIIKQRSHDS
ncbi:UNVERIFIED_CONTAM: hypothetical protein Scaly_1353800 [Sesamum calycinum]|uniref:Dehydrin n=1 Tax=Sesamum calycinum TaxID=2727403 RepID=A0AAW2PQ66_9LAMI